MSFIKLSDIEEREIIKGYKARFVHSDSMTLASWNIEAGRPMPEHSHDNEQISAVQKGRFELTIDGESRVMEPGAVAVIPARTPHSGKAVTDCEIIDVFYPVREDYKLSRRD